MESNSIDRIYWDAAQIASPAERKAYLDEACGDNVRLRQTVEQLLELRSRAETFLESPAVDARSPLGGKGKAVKGITTIDAGSLREGLGTLIGPYKLLEQIGEGGFGIVFMAEQQQPVRRKVALKILRPGMDTRQVIARFEAERQALAIMDHPHIAKVLDAGQTETGRPYFVMDLVKGLPITDYCDQTQLTPRERLQLFFSVCQAVQHAHQKGIIHRDLKPSNVLVTQQDGTPLVKVIDFGIAKALGQQLTDRTLFTGFAQMIGTPLYMSPEQTALSNVDVDTRSDIYSLGVLLYELLTGTTPFDKERLRGAGYDEMRRIIQEEEPARPSVRLSTLGQAAGTVSAHRKTDPRRLSQLLRGELDWVVMKALEKDRNRRYESASAFAADVQRYLADEPVHACPPSAWYKFRKFARRKKAALAVAACLFLVFAVLAGSGAWTAGQRAAQKRERERGVSSSVTEARVLLAEGKQLHDNPEHWRRTLPLARLAVERAEGLLTTGAVSEGLAEQVREVREAVDTAEKDSRLLVELDRIRLRRSIIVEGNRFDNRGAERDYAATFRDAGLGEEGCDPETVAARLRGSAVGEQLVAALDDWAAVTEDRKQRVWLLQVACAADPDAWRDRFRDPKVWGDRATLEALAGELLRDEAMLAKQKPQLLAALGETLRRTKADAAPLLAAAQARHPHDFWLNLDLAHSFHDAKKWDEAVGFYRAAVAVRPSASAAHGNLGIALYEKQQLGEAILELRTAIGLDSQDAAGHNNLGLALRAKGQLDEAIREYRTAIELDPKYANGHNNLGVALYANHQLDEAIQEYRQAIEIEPTAAAFHSNLGYALRDKKQLDEAIRECQTAIEIDDSFAQAHNNLGLALADKRQLDEAIREYRKAIKIDPKLACAHFNLGLALRANRQLDEAIREYRCAIELDPKDATAQTSLGNALADNKQLEEAIQEYRRAIQLDFANAKAHHGLGNALYHNKQVDEALREWRTAIELDPKEALAHFNLGLALRANRQLDEAIEEFRRAIDIDNSYAPAHNNLGLALYDKKQLDEAIREYRTAIEIDDSFAPAHLNLGNALSAKQRLEEAIQQYRRAINIEPKLAQPHGALGRTLLQVGRFTEARESTRHCLELLQRDDPIRPSVTRQLQQCEQLLVLDQKLAAIREGKEKPANDAERLALAWFCQQPFKKLNAASCGFYAEAFVHDAKLAADMRQQYRYNAACAAALAGCGRGNDAHKLDDKERARLRQQTVAWLRADLTYWTTHAEGGKPDDRKLVQEMLKHWQEDADLVGLRDKDALAKLPADEREACKQLWVDVERLLKQVQDKN